MRGGGLVGVRAQGVLWKSRPGLPSCADSAHRYSGPRFEGRYSAKDIICITCAVPKWVQNARSSASACCTNDHLGPLPVPSARCSVASPRWVAVPSRQSIHPGRRLCPPLAQASHKCLRREWSGHPMWGTSGSGAAAAGTFYLRCRRRHREGPKESPTFL